MKAKKVILIVGNMGAGKSTLCQILSEKLEWKWLAMDNFRNQAQKESWGGEHEAQKELLYQLLNTDLSIYETTAHGNTYHTVMKLLRKHQISHLTIKLECSPEICHSRLMERNSLPNFPKRMNLWNSLWLLHDSLEKVQAHLSINVASNTPEEIATAILDTLSKK